MSVSYDEQRRLKEYELLMTLSATHYASSVSLERWLVAGLAALMAFSVGTETGGDKLSWMAVSALGVGVTLAATLRMIALGLEMTEIGIWIRHHHEPGDSKNVLVPKGWETYRNHGPENPGYPTFSRIAVLAILAIAASFGPWLLRGSPMDAGDAGPHPVLFCGGLLGVYAAASAIGVWGAVRMVRTTMNPAKKKRKTLPNGS